MSTLLFVAVIALSTVTVTIADEDIYASCHAWTMNALSSRDDYDTCYLNVLTDKLAVLTIDEEKRQVLSQKWSNYDDRTVLSRAIAGTTGQYTGRTIAFPKVIGFLLRHADLIDLDAVDRSKSTALHVAASKNNLVALNLLVKLNQSILLDSEGRTALHIAVSEGNVEAVEILVQIKGFVTTNDKDERSALWLAETHNDVVKGDLTRSALLKGGATPFEGHFKGMNDIYAVCDKTVGAIDIYDYDACYLKTLEKKVDEEDTSQFRYKWPAFQGRTILSRAIAGHHRYLGAKLRYPRVVEYLLGNINGNQLGIMAADDRGRTALHIAVLYRNIAALEQLKYKSETSSLSSSLSPNTADTENRTALHYAVINGDVDAVQLLVKIKDIDLNLGTDANGRTALHFAEALSPESTGALIRTALMEAGADPLRNHYADMKDIYATCDSGYMLDDDDFEACYMKILKERVKWNDLSLFSWKWSEHEGMSILGRAIIDNHVNVIKYLVMEPKARAALDLDNLIDANKDSPLHNAVNRKNLPALELLAKTKMSPNGYDAKGRTALHIAVNEGDVQAVKLLIDNMSIDFSLLDHDEKTVLWLAETSKDVVKGNQIRSALLKGGATPFEDHIEGMNDIYAVCDKKHRLTNYDSCYVATLKEKVDEDDTRQFSYKWPAFKGRTLLARAIAGHDFNLLIMRKIEFPQLVTYLLANIDVMKVDLGATDSQGATFLHLAALYNNIAALGQLVKLAPSSLPSTNAFDLHNRTALHCAVKNGNVEAVRLLLTIKGIDLNLANKDGRTALHFAEAVSPAVTGALIQTELLKAGANPLKTHFPDMKDIYATCDETVHYGASVESCYVKILQAIVSRNDFALLSWRWEQFSGQSVLERAIVDKHMKVFKYLFDTPEALAAFNLNAVDDNGHTLLQLAALNQEAVILICDVQSKLDLEKKPSTSKGSSAKSNPDVKTVPAPESSLSSTESDVMPQFLRKTDDGSPGSISSFSMALTVMMIALSIYV